MVKGRNSVVVSFRVSDEEYHSIGVKALRKGVSASELCKCLVLKEFARTHKKKEVNHGTPTDSMS